MKCTLTLALALLFVAGTLAGCSGKKHVAAPDERPGQPRQDDPRYQETETRAPYAVDVPVQE